MTKDELDLVIITLREVDMVPLRDYEKMARIILTIFGRVNLIPYLGMPNASIEQIVTRLGVILRNEY